MYEVLRLRAAARDPLLRETLRKDAKSKLDDLAKELKEMEVQIQAMRDQLSKE